MPRFRNYYNKRGNHNRIYSMDELYKMPMGDFIDKEDELDYQDSTIGLPYDEELKSSKNVRFIDGFTQDDGNVIPSRWESFAPANPINPIDGSPSLTGGIIGNTNDKLTQLPSPIKEEPLFKFEKENEFKTIKPYKGDTSSPLGVNGDKLANNLPQQQPQGDIDKADDLLAQNTAQKTNTLEQTPQTNNIHTHQPEAKTEAVQQPQLSQNLSEYIEALLGNTPNYNFIGNETKSDSNTVSKNPTLYGYVTNTPDVIEKISDEHIYQYQDAKGNWHNSDITNNATIDETWKYITGLYGTGKLAKLGIEYGPYAKDIWNGKNLILHKPFDKMTKEEFENFKKMGEDFYQKYLQKNPVKIKDYGEVTFGRHNKGKDKTTNYEQYPFLRKNLESSKYEKTTNTKNETDREYDHFLNTYKNNLYDYIIEAIKERGNKYKMMKKRK